MPIRNQQSGGRISTVPPAPKPEACAVREGKRSVTPLWIALELSRGGQSQSAVAAGLCRRTPNGVLTRCTPERPRRGKQRFWKLKAGQEGPQACGFREGGQASLSCLDAVVPCAGGNHHTLITVEGRRGGEIAGDDTKRR